MDVADVAAVAVVADRTVGLVIDHLAEADDRVQRRAQLMAHIGQEFGLHAAGGLGPVLGRGQLDVGDFQLGILGLQQFVGDHEVLLGPPFVRQRRGELLQFERLERLGDVEEAPRSAARSSPCRADRCRSSR